MRERWFGSTGRRVPQIAIDGEVDLDGALVLDDLDVEQIQAAFEEGRPVVIRAESKEEVLEALKRPEVSSVIAPPDLLQLDLVELTYGS